MGKATVGKSGSGSNCSATTVGRGNPAGSTSLAEQPNVEALEELLIRVSRLVEAFPEIGYVDLDPVLVNATGAHVLGARVWLREAPEVRPDVGPRRLRGVTF